MTLISFDTLACAPRSWQTKPLKIGEGWYGGYSGAVSSHGERVCNILDGATYATLFAYLWRRFGPPSRGWDDHKELVNYSLTTPVKGIGFGVACSPCGLRYTVSYYLSPEWHDACQDYERGALERWYDGLARHCFCNDRMLLNDAVVIAAGREPIWNTWSRSHKATAARLVRDYINRVGPRPGFQNPGERLELSAFSSATPIAQMPASPHRVILSAIEAGARDLLRPVNVRDSYINACGNVADNAIRRPVRPSSLAGYGLPTDLMKDPDLWLEVVESLRKLGLTKALSRLRPQPGRKAAA